MMNPPGNRNDDMRMELEEGSSDRSRKKIRPGVEGQITQRISQELRDSVTGHEQRLDKLQPKKTPMKIFHVPALTALENVKRDNINEYQTNLAFSLITGQDESTLFSLSAMPKSTVMHILTQAFPHNRPQTVPCSYQMLTEAIEHVDTSEVYIKGNTAGAEDVYHVILLDDGKCRVISRDYPEMVVPVLALGDGLKRLQGGANNSDALLAEEAIPIPQTSGGSTWEMRFYSSIKKELTRPSAWMKVAQPHSSFNNISQGGSKKLFHGQYEAALDDVIGKCLGDVNGKEALIIAERDRFLEEAEKLADDVRHCLEQHYQSDVRRFVLPSDLNNPSEYEEMLRECFCTIVLDVDITGTWDEGQRRLKPMIMEVNEEFSLKDSVRDMLVTGLKDVGVSHRHERLRKYLKHEAAERLLCSVFEQVPEAFEQDFTDCFNGAGAIHWTRPDGREIWRLEVAKQMSAFFDNYRDFLSARPEIAAVVRTSFLKALVGDMEFVAEAGGTAMRKPIDFNNPSIQKGLSELFNMTVEDFQDQPEPLRGDLCMTARTAKLNQTIPDSRISEVIEKAGIIRQGITSR